MKAIEITAKHDGFRRAGLAHVGTRRYPAAAFTDAQRLALANEPMLVVHDIEVADDAQLATPQLRREIAPPADRAVRPKSKPLS